MVLFQRNSLGIKKFKGVSETKCWINEQICFSPTLGMDFYFGLRPSITGIEQWIGKHGIKS